MERFEGFTAIYEPTDDGWIFARVLEVPGAFSQGRDMEEAREMLRDALLLMLEANREDAEVSRESYFSRLSILENKAVQPIEPPWINGQ